MAPQLGFSRQHHDPCRQLLLHELIYTGSHCMDSNEWASAFRGPPATGTSHMGLGTARATRPRKRALAIPLGLGH